MYLIKRKKVIETFKSINLAVSGDSSRAGPCLCTYTVCTLPVTLKGKKLLRGRHDLVVGVGFPDVVYSHIRYFAT